MWERSETEIVMCDTRVGFIFQRFLIVMHIHKKVSQSGKKRTIWPSSIKINQKFRKYCYVTAPNPSLNIKVNIGWQSTKWKFVFICVFGFQIAVALFHYVTPRNEKKDKNLISSHHHPKGNKWIFIVEEPENSETRFRLSWVGKRVSYSSFVIVTSMNGLFPMLFISVTSRHFQILFVKDWFIFMASGTFGFLAHILFRLN